MADELEFRIARLELQRGDILVVKGIEPFPTKRWRGIIDLMPPGVRVLFIPSDVELSVLTDAEINARAIG